jgi:flavin-dependent trigonelline monooxygenase, reductase component
VDADTPRHTLRHFRRGVTVAATCDPAGAPVGMTANAFTLVSPDPPLVLLCVAHSAATFSATDSATRYAVHILSEAQLDVSRAFARSAADGAEKFAEIDWQPSARRSTAA